MTHIFSNSSFKCRPYQQGLTLIELMIGIALGLLAIAVAMGALIASKNASTTTSDSTTMQQQASFVFRVIGQQIRQAGSLSLKPSDSHLETAQFIDSTSLSSYTAISGKDAPGSSEYLFTVVYQNSPSEKLYPISSGTASTGAQLRNCLGENPSSSPPAALQNAFKRDGNILYCAGTGSKQPLIGGDSANDIKVKNFQVRYLRQTGETNPTFTYVTAAALTDKISWSQVQSIEVCLELEGSENIDTVGSSYINCNNQSVSRGSRLRSVFRNTFRSRSNAWPVSN